VFNSAANFQSKMILINKRTNFVQTVLFNWELFQAISKVFFIKRESFALMHGINFGLGFYDQPSRGKVFGT